VKNGGGMYVGIETTVFFSLGSFKVSGLSVFTTENMGAGFVKLKTQ